MNISTEELTALITERQTRLKHLELKASFTQGELAVLYALRDELRAAPEASDGPDTPAVSTNGPACFTDAVLSDEDPESAPAS